jgi:hypothetical protein
MTRTSAKSQAQTWFSNLLSQLFTQQKIFPLILAITIIHGLVYVVRVPPWQHYDEPTHFEYAYILASRQFTDLSLLPDGATDPIARQSIAASMIEHGFFANIPLPNLLTTENVWIGVMQVNDQPLYYTLLSLPLRLLRYTDVTTQLMAGRLVSLMLYVLTVWVAAKASAVLFAPQHPLRWLVPLMLATLPSVTDIMTAVNDDVGAVFVMSLFFLCAIRLLKNGINMRDMVAAVIVVVGCVFTKSTAVIAVPLFVLTLALTLLRRRAWWVWAGVAACVPIFLGLSLTFGDAQSWYRGQGQQVATSASGAGIPVGERAFQLQVEPNTPAWGVGIRQPLSPAQIAQLQGKRVTLGAYMWASALPTGTVARTPIFSDQNINLNAHDLIYISTQPTFYSFSLTVPSNANFASIVLAPFRTANVPATVYFDGVVLAEGDFSPNTTPQFASPSGTDGTWDGKAFVNILRNPSAENRWLMLRPTIDRQFTRFIGSQASSTLSSLFDLGTTGWYYRTAIVNLLRSFWASFGWGHVLLTSSLLYVFLVAVWLLGMAGAVVQIVRWISAKQFAIDHLRTHVILLFSVSILIVWALTIQRGLEFALFYNLFVPSARYTFTAILPTVIMLCYGWWVLAKLASHRLHRPTLIGWLGGMFVLFIASLDLISIMRIVSFYSNR